MERIATWLFYLTEDVNQVRPRNGNYIVGPDQNVPRGITAVDQPGEFDLSYTHVCAQVSSGRGQRKRTRTEFSRNGHLRAGFFSQTTSHGDDFEEPFGPFDLAYSRRFNLSHYGYGLAVKFNDTYTYFRFANILTELLR